jgi:hypothetical protein
MCNIVSFIIPPYSNFIEKIHQSYFLHTGNINLTPLKISKFLEKVINRLYSFPLKEKNKNVLALMLIVLLISQTSKL